MPPIEPLQRKEKLQTDKSTNCRPNAFTDNTLYFMNCLSLQYLGVISLHSSLTADSVARFYIACASR